MLLERWRGQEARRLLGPGQHSPGREFQIWLQGRLEVWGLCGGISAFPRLRSRNIHTVARLNRQGLTSSLRVFFTFFSSKEEPEKSDGAMRASPCGAVVPEPH